VLDATTKNEDVMLVCMPLYDRARIGRDFFTNCRHCVLVAWTVPDVTWTIDNKH
jgi:hypothetical protein